MAEGLISIFKLIIMLSSYWKFSKLNTYYCENPMQSKNAAERKAEFPDVLIPSSIYFAKFSSPISLGRTTVLFLLIASEPDLTLTNLKSDLSFMVTLILSA